MELLGLRVRLEQQVLMAHQVGHQVHQEPHLLRERQDQQVRQEPLALQGQPALMVLPAHQEVVHQVRVAREAPLGHRVSPEGPVLQGLPEPLEPVEE